MLSLAAKLQMIYLMREQSIDSLTLELGADWRHAQSQVIQAAIELLGSPDASSLPPERTAWLRASIEAERSARALVAAALGIP